jgi:hypothetical protein
MHLFTKHLGLALAVSLVAVACAAPAIPNDTFADAEDDDTSGSTTKKSPPKKSSSPAPSDDAPEGDPTTPTTPGTPAPPDAPPTTPPPAGSCAGQQGDACFDCCDQASGGTLATANDAFGQCACGAGGQCTSVCGTFCGGGQPSAACDQCLTQTCDPAAEALCTSAACQAGLTCLDQCQ